VTSDKRDHAISIANRAGLIPKFEKVCSIKASSEKELALLLDDIDMKAEEIDCFETDGPTLAIALWRYNLESQLFNILVRSKSVFLYKLTQAQKGQIMTLARTYTGRKNCAIGTADFHDIELISEADVGVLIEIPGLRKQMSLTQEPDVLLNDFSHFPYLIVMFSMKAFNQTQKLIYLCIKRHIMLVTARLIWDCTSGFSYNQFNIPEVEVIHTFFVTPLIIVACLVTSSPHVMPLSVREP